MAMRHNVIIIRESGDPAKYAPVFQLSMNLPGNPEQFKHELRISGSLLVDERVVPLSDEDIIVLGNVLLEAKQVLGERPKLSERLQDQR
jgi:hypothetical protein